MRPDGLAIELGARIAMSVKPVIPEGYIPQPRLPRLLVAEYGVPVHEVPSYRRISYDATNMKIPSVIFGERYYVARADISKIIEFYGLTSIAVDLQPVATAA
jgi:hypothetical protein